MKVRISKKDIPYYMFGPYVAAAQKMVEDLAPTAVAYVEGSTLVIQCDDENELKQFVHHVEAMSAFFTKTEVIP